jgi:hypothetical protein
MFAHVEPPPGPLALGYGHPWARRTKECRPTRCWREPSTPAGPGGIEVRFGRQVLVPLHPMKASQSHIRFDSIGRRSRGGVAVGDSFGAPPILHRRYLHPPSHRQGRWMEVRLKAAASPARVGGRGTACAAARARRRRGGSPPRPSMAIAVRRSRRRTRDQAGSTRRAAPSSARSAPGGVGAGT